MPLACMDSLKSYSIPSIYGRFQFVRIGSEFFSFASHLTLESFHGKTNTGGTKGRKLAKSVFFVILDTILSNLSKVIEKLLYNRILTFLEDTEFFDLNQYGFLPRSNTTSAALSAKFVCLPIKEITLPLFL
jgi:hypothetical protein